MASIERSTPRGSWSAFGTHLLLALLTLCLFFEILRLLTFTSATPNNHLAHRRDDYGSNDASMYHGVIHPSIKPSEISKRDLGDSLMEFGNKIMSIFDPSDNTKTPVEAVSEHAYDELKHQIPLKELTEAFERSYGKMTHSGNKKADDDVWIRDQIENVIPELKKKYDEANKSDSASKHHECDIGEDLKMVSKDTGNKVRDVFISNGNQQGAVEFVSEYAYDRVYHHIPLDWLTHPFEKSHEAMKHSDNQTTDTVWVNDQIDNVFPQLQQIYDQANKGDSDSKG